MSTWQGHIRQRRYPTAESPTSGRHRASSGTSSMTSPASPIAPSHSSPSLTSTHPHSRIDGADRRVDATTQLLGRSSSVPASIFSPSIGDRGRDDPPWLPQQTTSPTRNTSPEIARRASRFEFSVKPSPTRTQFPTHSRRDAHHFPKASTTNTVAESFDDPFAEIERRRFARQARLESIRNLYPVTRAEHANSGPPSPVHEQWDEIERKERLQVEAERGAGTAPDKIASAPRISSSTDTFCEVSGQKVRCRLVI